MKSKETKKNRGMMVSTWLNANVCSTDTSVTLILLLFTHIPSTGNGEKQLILSDDSYCLKQKLKMHTVMS